MLGGKAAVLDNVLKGIIDRARFAAVVALRCGAVHQLLFGGGHKLARGDGMRTLDCACGGKGPAREALALVLDMGDGVLGAPIDSGVVRNGWKSPLIALQGQLDRPCVSGCKLPAGQIGKLRDAELERLARIRIVLANVRQRL